MQIRSKKANEPRTKVLLFATILSVILIYGFGSWSIDSGSMLAYILTFVALYYTVKFSTKLINRQFLNNDKKPKATKARSPARR